MKKKITVAVLSIMMALGTVMSVSASQDSMMITYPEPGITEGDTEEMCITVDGDVYSVTPRMTEVVGNGAEDAGPWEHGVTAGQVYSRYTNKKYWHGSSVRGSGGTVRSKLVAANKKSSATVFTAWVDGNHAYWRVDENKK